MPARMLILLNKPYGVVCQFSGDGSPRLTLAAFVDVPDVYPAGRLDHDSEGLVLLTDDGRLQQRLSDPRFGKEKVYLAEVERIPDAAALSALARGIPLPDGPTRPAGVRLLLEPPDLWPRDPPVRFRKNVPTAWLELTLREGRNRQVRRMTAAVGHPTLRLVRTHVAGYGLGELLPGQWRTA